MEQKILNSSFDIKELGANGAFEGYASVFNALDNVKDKVAKGAFKQTLESHRKQGRLPAMLWQHDTREPIGVWREMFEDAKGLYVKGELFINEIPRAKQAYKLLKENALSGLSIGFKAIESELSPKTGERILTKIDLLEVSMVTFPALDSARISSVKSALAVGALPHEREFEAFLRDAGFSRKQAKGLISNGYKSLTQRDAGNSGEDAVAAIKNLAATLRCLSH